MKINVQDIIVIAVLSLILVGGYFLTHHKTQKVISHPVVVVKQKPAPVVPAPIKVTPVPVTKPVVVTPVVTPKPVVALPAPVTPLARCLNHGVYPRGINNCK
jgi:hypothetical protein